MTASNGDQQKGSPVKVVAFPAKFEYSSSSEEEDDDNEGYRSPASNADGETEPSVLDPRDQNTADNWIPRNPSMVRLTGKHPFNAEAPLPKLMSSGFITPVPLHYVRNHGPVPKSTWEEWTIEVTGLVKKPALFTMNQLVTEFPSKEFPVTLVCAGNRRKEQNMVKQTIGFNWGAAGVSTSVWRGVPLRAVLIRCGIMSNRKGALNVCFEGAEDLPGGGGSKYGTSLRKEVAMDPARDIILAYMQNGERLTPDHGFPLRIIIPGFIGGRMVKWLKRIIVTTAESDNYYHYKDNRVFPSSVHAELADSQGWWYKPEYIINELNVNSVITTPCHGEVLLLAAQTAYSLRGYAYSGGGRRVTRVEVSTDGGGTWRVCALDRPEKPNRYGKYWCWCFWSLEVEAGELLGAKEIAVRAWDEALNTQPENLIWNLMGMMNNCWFRVKVTVRQALGETAIVFEHPTLPGNDTGGWMTKQVRSVQEDKSVSLPNAPSDVFSVSEVEKHRSTDSAWIIVHGNIYDCTRFLKDHPGGADSILINAGTDCTEEFDAIHSASGKKMLEEYRIGKLGINGKISEEDAFQVKSDPESPLTATKGESVALDPHQKISCKLVAKTKVSHDVRLLRFALPEAEQLLGLPVGKHIFLYVTIQGKLCIRAYTPSSDPRAIGYFELVVKIYFKGKHPDFPDGGLMSQHLDTLELGSSVEVKGPVGHIEYTGQGSFLVHGKPRCAKKLAMIAGGTGITPIYQVMQAVMTDPDDRTEMHLVYANRTEEDILLREQIDSWAEKCPEKLKVWYVVSESVKQGWKYSVGIINETVLREHIPAASEYTLALACGPPGMLQFSVKPNLERMGYDLVESLFIF